MKIFFDDTTLLIYAIRTHSVFSYFYHFLHLFKKLFNSCFQPDILSLHFFYHLALLLPTFPYSPWNRSQIGSKLILFRTSRKY